MVDLRAALLQRLADGLAVHIAMHVDDGRGYPCRERRPEADQALYDDLSIDPDGWVWLIG